MNGEGMTTRTGRRPRSWRWWLYQPYKWLVVLPVLVLSTVVLGIIAILASFVVKPSRVSALTGAPWARLNARVTPMLIEVSGRSHLNPAQSYVLVSNHQSLYDILLLYGWLGIDFRWVMKKELRKIPVLGVACERMGHIFIDRSNRKAALATIENARKRITNGTSVLFFPEGTRTKDGRLGRFKTGAFRMAIDLKLPVLPMTILGTREILPAGSRELRPGRARLIIHPPVSTEGLDAGGFQDLLDEVRGIIAAPLV
jgi:1-acyl-sn-glycerol-3-phosphate acyltransferase